MKIKHVLLVVLFLFVSLAVPVLLVYEFRGNPRQQKNTITILRGENAFQIAEDLKLEGYIKSKIFFLFYVIAAGHLKDLKAGEYDLKELAYQDIVNKLAAAQVVERRITIIPGWTVYDVFNNFKKEGLADDSRREEIFLVRNYADNFVFLKNAPIDGDLEGYLFPDTYFIINQTTGPEAVKLVLENFGKKIPPVLLKEVERSGHTLHEAIIMASMIEKEVRTLEDKKIVSGILWKRLKAGMPLQVDSALLYSKESGVKAFDMDSGDRYNTYKYGGLPVGPICNPGLESIEAAIEPMDSDYWFYLSARDGKTIFAKNYEEHLANKSKYLDSAK